MPSHLHHGRLEFVLLDECACPKPLYPVLRKLKADTGCTYASIYRGDAAKHLLNAHGKHTQRQLVEATPAERAAWGVLGTPNPFGQSTHELFSDGVAYNLPVGTPLAWWKCGIDVDDAHVHAMIVAAARHGWTLEHPYTAGVEYHHLNFKHKPTRWREFYAHVYGHPHHRHIIHHRQLEIL